MKIRTLIICILAVLVVSSVSPAQETVALEQKLQELATSTPTPQAPRPRRRIAKPAATPSSVHPMVLRTKQAAPQGPTVVKIFELKYAKAESLAVLIGNLFRIQVQNDYRLNRLIVNATQEQMDDVESLIEAMDVAGSEVSKPQDTQDLIYRIYMFEIASGDEGMKPFSMILRTSTHVSSQELLDAAADKDLQVSEFLQSNDFNEPQVEILIQGKAASNESLKRMVSGLAPKSHIIELKWDDDETFTNNIAAAQYTRLPEQMQKHIRKFLGHDIRTVGYWFGNLSVPGSVEAPIGPWKLSLQLDTESDRMVQLQVDVEAVGEEEQIGEQTWRQQIDEILSNTLRAKIGKPIIIGYNRESYGTRKMGAMVIIPEVDMIQLEGNK